ncbi:MAG: NifB/NifX family molybdenum-iron cluster-binding protein [Desulfobacteraceae bacterium]|jgi:predicted Fe-Mo cluster-binding NifX family protein
MRIAVTSNGPSLDAVVEPRFGRSPYFLCIDPDTLVLEAIPNPNMALSGGAGPQSAQLMAEKGVSAVLTGNCGPNAFQAFGAAGIQVITGVSGLVREAVDQFKAGRLKPAATPSVRGHFGTGGRPGGRGMGRRMGTGRIRGPGARRTP